MSVRAGHGTRSASPAARHAASPVVARTCSADATRTLGAALARVLRVGDVVLVAGELGAGKTTLVQGMAAGLGVTDHVTSPTFTLVRPYRCDPCERAPGGADPGVSGIRALLHADLYRLDRLAEVADLALGELVEDGAVAVVEWGEVAEPILGADALHVHLELGTSDDERRVSVVVDSSWEARRPDLEALAGTWGDDRRGRAR